MKNILGSLVIASLLFVSCKKEEQTAEKPANDDVSVFSDSYSGQIDTTAVAPVATTTPATTGTPNMMTTTQTATVPAAAAVAKGMNPAHGQPGHRCDIAVGAPLNSTPNKPGITTTPGKATVQPMSAPTTISSTSAPGTVTSNGATITTVNNNAPAPTAPGMNPPHGQEGHDCAVAVGAPLPKK